MKVLEVRSALLTNYEVNAHLEELTALQDSMLKKGNYSSALESENLRTVQFELKQYLADQPCQTITPESLLSLLRALKEGDFGLTKAEKLMILNQVPGNEAEISVLLEEYGDRFSEEQRVQLLSTIEECLGRRPINNDEQEAVDEEDGNNMDQSDGPMILDK